MLRTVKIASTQFRRFADRAGVLGLMLLVALVARASGQAPSEYRNLVSRIPSGSNAVVIFNVQKLLNSPMGVRQGWAKNLEKAHADGVSRVPPQVDGLVLAAQMDFNFVKPIWEATVGHLREPLPLEDIAKRRSGIRDTVDGMKAVELPNDTYVVQFDADTLAAMGPANRQLVLQWVRAVKAGAAISPYLQRAAGYSDEAGTEIIIAADLDGAYAPETIRAYLESKRQLLDSLKIDAQQVAQLLASVQGLRIGIRVGDKPFGKLVIDFGTPVNLPAESFRTLLVEMISDAGLKIGDFGGWKAESQGKEFSLAGYLAESGLRRIFSLVESPLPTQAPQEAQVDNSPSSAKGQMATNTLRQFDTITKMFNDLKQDWRDLKSLSSASIFFDRYAKRIENLPVLNVDPDMLKYRDFVAAQLRTASGSVRAMGIRSGARQMQAGSADAYYGGYYGGYRSGWYGGYGPGRYVGSAIAATNAFQDATAAQGAQRRAIRSEEKTAMAVDVQTIRSNVIQATNETRRTMTERYQIEF